LVDGVAIVTEVAWFASST